VELRHLRHVVALAEAGTFTAAADDLGITQPSLSQSIRGLEIELGVALFLRRGRSVALTSAGSALLGPARATIRDAETALAAVESVLGLRGGSLDVVVLPTLAVDPAARIVGRFRRSHPGVRLSLREPEAVGDVVEMVTSGLCEIGIADRLPPSAALIAERLMVQDYMVVAPPGARLVDEQSAMDLIADHALLTTPAGTSTRLLTDEALAHAGVTASIAVETAHREALIPLVLAGAGATLLPEPLAAQARERGAVVVRPEPTVTRSVALVRRSEPVSPAAAAFLDVARSICAGVEHGVEHGT
jgi:DNA-binding transcriptional LysR family regulator